MTDADYLAELLQDLPTEYVAEGYRLMERLQKANPLEGLQYRTRALDVARSLWAVRKAEQSRTAALIQQHLARARAAACEGHDWGPWREVAIGLRRRTCYRCFVDQDSDQSEPGKEG